MKRIESLLKIAGMKFELSNLKIRFHKRKVSFLVFKITKGTFKYHITLHGCLLKPSECRHM